MFGMTDETRCDFCNSTQYVLWEWETPNAEGLTMEQAMETGAFYAEDPWWYACDTCHRMILADRQESLLERALAQQARVIAISPDENNVWHPVDMKAHVTRIHGAFWTHKTQHRRL